ncbi:MAG: DNA mismatch repair protein MutS, partial [Saprospiraceae bacterium]|nr:DNA mismatch repair protein MutS [Saprospiraceae bacterium]
SALLRQTALICLMAQMGSFVPAANARLGIIDKVFTRVGASDNISSGESTFMVEMNETASIMNNMSDRSLILLDEIGRGTSTYDGISIAWSIAEFLHNNGQTRPKTLFATHYHELNELAGQLPRIKNFHVATREIDQKIIFLRTLVSGGSEHSFGIQVAKMAGMPKNIVDRATQILGELEKKSIGQEESAPQPGRSGKQKTVSIEVPNYQLSIFDMPDPVLETIRQQLLDMDLNSLTPIDCLYKLRALQLMISPEKN